MALRGQVEPEALNGVAYQIAYETKHKSTNWKTNQKGESYLGALAERSSDLYGAVARELTPRVEQVWKKWQGYFASRPGGSAKAEAAGTGADHALKRLSSTALRIMAL